jgi:hypothetical protein
MGGSARDLEFGNWNWVTSVVCGYILPELEANFVFGLSPALVLLVIVIGRSAERRLRQKAGATNGSDMLIKFRIGVAARIHGW